MFSSKNLSFNSGSRIKSKAKMKYYLNFISIFRSFIYAQLNHIMFDFILSNINIFMNNMV